MPQYSWGLNSNDAPPFNPQPETAVMNDAGNNFGGGSGAKTKPGANTQEEHLLAMLSVHEYILPKKKVDAR